jgi:hypothetical protein|tara:strand:- start:151 stop:297 length:147 start_codon:yes stop_codon:yes gene_type:complete
VEIDEPAYSAKVSVLGIFDEKKVSYSFFASAQQGQDTFAYYDELYIHV